MTKHSSLHNRFLHSVLSLAAFFTLGLGTTFAQTASRQPAARLTAEVNSNERATLPGSLHPLAKPANESGRLAAGTRLEGISLYFSRSAAQTADLLQLQAAQQDPTSAQYHKWLTPEQFGARFGMADSDIAKVQTWLEQQGFSVDSVGRSKTMIRFSGTSGQVEQAFGTEMHSFTLNGEKHIAPATALSIPSSLASVVLGVRNLDNFRPTAHIKIKPQTHPVASFTGTSSSGTEHLLTPGDITTIYDVKSAYTAGYTGAGQAIAIIGQSDVDLKDVAAFRSAAGLAAKAPTKILVPGSGAAYFSPGDQSESDLDLEWAGSIAKDADIFFIYTGDNIDPSSGQLTYSAFDSALYAIDNLIAPIISSSYGTCEANVAGTSALQVIDSALLQATVQGQTVLSASGDSGATDCYDSSTGAGGTAFSLDYPGSSQYVTGVGGTEFNEGSGSYWNSTNASDYSSATSYIPEVVWNDDSTTNGLSSSGGGVSVLYSSKPTWQTGVQNIPKDNARDVPDISLDASNDHDGYLYCTSDTSTWATSQTATCSTGFLDSNGYATVAGGTSFSTPIMAAMLAIINQKQNSTGQGLINPTLYQLAANTANYANSTGAFHDITSGTNACGSQCPSGVTAKTGFAAGVGYDAVSGIGSVDLNNLAAIWPTSAAGTEPTLTATTTTITGPTSAVALGTAITFSVSVSPTAATGTVTFTLDGVSSTANLVNGVATSNSITFSSAGSAGNHIMVATYSGDATYASSSATASINVLSSAGSFTLTAASSTITLSSSTSCTISGTSYPIACDNITVTPVSGYSGTVDLNVYTNSVTFANAACWTFVTSSSAFTNATATVSGGTAGTVQIVLSNNASFCNNSGNYIGGSVRPTHRFKVMQSSSATSTTVKAGVWMISLFFAALIGLRFRKIRGYSMLVLLLAGLGFGMTACGGGSSNSGGGGGGGGTSYTVTVIGNDTVSPSLTASTSVTVTIQ